MFRIWYNIIVGADVKKQHPIKNGLAPFLRPPQDARRRGNNLGGGLPFFFEKGNSVTTKRKQLKSIEKPRRLPPIVIVPDKTYIDDTGNLIPTDVILVSDPTMYERMLAVIEAWGKEPIGVPGKRGMKKIDCLKQFLIRCCYQYYVKSISKIPDRLYDGLFKDLQHRESMRLQKEGIEPDSDSPTQMIWGDRDEQYPDWAKEWKKMECCTE